MALLGLAAAAVGVVVATGHIAARPAWRPCFAARITAPASSAATPAASAASAAVPGAAAGSVAGTARTAGASEAVPISASEQQEQGQTSRRLAAVALPMLALLLAFLPRREAQAEDISSKLPSKKSDLPNWMQNIVPDEKAPVPSRDMDTPPEPDKNDFIRKLQEKTWEMQPVIRTREYLFRTFQEKYQPNPFASQAEQRFAVRQASNKDAWDVLDNASFQENFGLGKIIIDTELTSKDFTTYAYTSSVDQDAVRKAATPCGAIELPTDLKQRIELIKSRKFGVAKTRYAIPESAPKKKDEYSLAKENELIR